MFDLAAATAAAERDFSAIIDQVDGLADSDWHAPVRCEGWRITDLAVHVAGAGRGQAEALRRAAAGQADLARLDPPASREPRTLLASLKQARDQLLAALRAVPGHALDGVVPLPFGLLPAAVALQIIPLEYGFHRNDLDWALGQTVPLTGDIASTLLAITPGLLPMLAAGTPVGAPGIPPAAAVSFRLSAPAARILARYETGQWSIGPDGSPAPVTCEISGDQSSLALFIMGRIDAGHPALTVSSPDAARAFKRYFPGP
jgi:uncharacterized protein (TIGR03083 family)